MVNAQEWLDQNYPKANRQGLTELDISNKDLEGDLDLTGLSLVKANFSFNKINSIIWDTSNLEEFDYSHNEEKGAWDGSVPGHQFPKLRKFNISNNFMQLLDLSQAPQLTHVDCSNNVLTNLTVQSNNLQQLNCSGNQITNLSLKYSPTNLTLFDCEGVKFDKLNTVAPTVTVTPTAPTETVTSFVTAMPSSLEKGLGAGFGLMSLFAIGGFTWALFLRNKVKSMK